MNLGAITRESIADYHATDCVGHSRLECFRDPDRGPARYHGLYIAKTIAQEPPTAAMDVGQAADALILEKRVDFIAHPPTYLGPESTKKDAPLVQKPWNWNANICKDWAAQQSAKIILSPDDAATVNAMAAAVQANPIAAALLSKGDPQLSFRYNFGPFRVQVRPDWWNKDGVALPDGTQLPNYLVDLKTAEDAAQFERNRRAHGYDRQAALYSEIVRMVLADAGGISLDEVAPIPFFFVVVYKTAPVQCVVTVLEKQDLADAIEQVADDIRRLKQCYQTGEWPGVPKGIVTLPSLDWRRAKNPEFQPEPAITFAASAEVALDPLRGIERENSEQREEGLRLRRCLHDIHGKISRGEALGVGDLNQIENALLAL
jgi:hypothetical protein